MDERALIEWQERRGISEFFWVRAEKQAGEWVFHDKSQWESRWYPLPTSAELVAQVEVRAGLLKTEA